MINTLKLKYKAETGLTPYIEIETEILTRTMDEVILSEMRVSEIVDMVKYDNKKNAGWGVFKSQLPKEFHDGEDLKIVTPEYIEWLESQLINKQPCQTRLFLR